ncbi:hypothetical protein Save01_02076 [Streptomyces avermitilis]|uniref:Secreted protein n=1 Tax=Streptomyces avermitilis (strain ATCC 31267 / DSM 46492 / JCM 5070 / NBRC 14893 / NCIMB 12804 / NRRL 8165 / MA-4680) TaxID=227882 RepID=Q82B89_STRAW|nr:putative secreted protein [Streptomyces avermitilis MA-4680 = NBRC 14893]
MGRMPRCQALSAFTTKQWGTKLSTLKQRTKLFSIAGTFIAASAMVTAIAPSAQAATPTDEQIRIALQHHADGTQTPADVAVIKSVPALAASVPDPTAPEEITTTEAVINANGQAVSPANGAPMTPEQLAEVMPPSTATPSDPSTEVTTPAETEVAPQGSAVAPGITGGTWKVTHITHTHRAYSHTVIFKYHTYASFNYGGGKVRGWRDRSDDITNTSVDVEIAPKRIVNTKSYTPASSATSQMKREIKLCVFKYGCYAILHPWAKVQVFGTGKTKIAGSGV